MANHHLSDSNALSGSAKITLPTTKYKATDGPWLRRATTCGRKSPLSWTRDATTAPTPPSTASPTSAGRRTMARTRLCTAFSGTLFSLSILSNINWVNLEFEIILVTYWQTWIDVKHRLSVVCVGLTGAAFVLRQATVFWMEAIMIKPTQKTRMSLKCHFRCPLTCASRRSPTQPPNSFTRL